jgi:hypothetical protein
LAPRLQPTPADTAITDTFDRARRAAQVPGTDHDAQPPKPESAAGQ